MPGLFAALVFSRGTVSRAKVRWTAYVPSRASGSLSNLDHHQRDVVGLLAVCLEAPNVAQKGVANLFCRTIVGGGLEAGGQTLIAVEIPIAVDRLGNAVGVEQEDIVLVAG